ncbi:hypothetical protein [Bradyrhizobium sp. STM 3843]|uniref:hypothetical protein n=1 Tax=Bradyrhizobium sp. STM 3843 TaxID=551947 RepID=UPI00111287BE|nr:hypothetical protein [Bradyrhizobium sp. STM 3843]
MREARHVLAYSRELALAVRNRTVKLDEALKQVEDERKALESSDAMMERLRAEAPDFTDLVSEERMLVADVQRIIDHRLERANDLLALIGVARRKPLKADEPINMLAADLDPHRHLAVAAALPIAGLAAR